MARHQLSKVWELRATTSLARLCQQTGRAMKRGGCSPTHMVGSPKASIRLTLRAPRRCWMNWMHFRLMG